MKATIGGGEGKAFMKLIVASDSDKVIGVHMIGPDCAEIMQVCPAQQWQNSFLMKRLPLQLLDGQRSQDRAPQLLWLLRA